MCSFTDGYLATIVTAGLQIIIRLSKIGRGSGRDELERSAVDKPGMLAYSYGVTEKDKNDCMWALALFVGTLSA